MELVTIVEALLFASPDAIGTEELARVVRHAAKNSEDEIMQAFAKTKTPEVSGAIDQLVETYEKEGRAFTLVERPRGWKICARPDYSEWVRHLFPEKKAERLSAPALETLAIIAYRQPVTKASVEAIRGVAVDGVLQKLIERELVQLAGRAELPGRPMLYETTDSFLEHFGIQEVKELPNSEELGRIELPTGIEEPEESGEEQMTLSETLVAGEESEAKNVEDQAGPEEEEK